MTTLAMACASIAGHGFSLAADPQSPCCTYDLALRGVADQVTYSASPLLRPGDRNKTDDYAQARLELSARAASDADHVWSFRGYVRTAGNLSLTSSESPALLKIREATADIPVLEGYVTLGRIVAGSGSLKIRNLVDFLDDFSVHTERRSGFLPERLANRIGHVGMQVAQVGDLGTLQVLWAPKLDLADSNHEAFTLVRATPALGSGSISMEALAFRSNSRVAYALQGTAAPMNMVQLYGELSHERRWPLLSAGAEGIGVRQVSATRLGAGIEYKPRAEWSVAMEAIYNNRPASGAAIEASQNFLASAPPLAAIAAAGSLQNLPFGLLQRLYYGGLVQRDWPDQKLSLAAAYFRAQGDGSAVATLEIKWDLNKNVQLSAFARSTSAQAGNELFYAAEERRIGIATTVVLQ